MVNFLFDSTNLESSVHSCGGTHMYTHAHRIGCPRKIQQTYPDKLEFNGATFDWVLLSISGFLCMQYWGILPGAIHCKPWMSDGIYSISDPSIPDNWQGMQTYNLCNCISWLDDNVFLSEISYWFIFQCWWKTWKVWWLNWIQACDLLLPNTTRIEGIV